jgi:ISXO2-like transposase domain
MHEVPRYFIEPVSNRSNGPGSPDRIDYPRGGAHVNTAESYFALLKRGVVGSFHHVSKEHLDRYCDEFSFRWDHRSITDSARTEIAIRQTEGKRLSYKAPIK